jgi:hypothetical protein
MTLEQLRRELCAIAQDATDVDELLGSVGELLRAVQVDQERQRELDRQLAVLDKPRPGYVVRLVRGRR